MHSSLKIGLIFGLTLLLIGGGAALVGYYGLVTPRQTVEVKKPEPPLESLLGPDFSLQNPNYSVMKDGKKQFEFVAGTVQESDNGRKVTLNGLHNGVYYKDGKPYLQLKSQSATYDHVKRELQLTGGVQVSGPNGLKFQAPSLVWQSDKKMIVCPGPVRLQTPDGWITSEGALVADLQKQSFSLQQVNGQFRLDSDVKGFPL